MNYNNYKFTGNFIQPSLSSAGTWTVFFLSDFINFFNPPGNEVPGQQIFIILITGLKFVFAWKGRHRESLSFRNTLGLAVKVEIRVRFRVRSFKVRTRVSFRYILKAKHLNLQDP